MGRMYVTKFKDTAVTAAQDLFEILAATGKPIEVHGWSVSQKTEVGDAQEEGILITTNRGVGSVTSGSGGSTHTPNPRVDSDAASGATVEINNTTVMAAGSGTLEEMEVYAWNLRATPFVMWYTPETRPYIVPGDRWTLEAETAPGDSVTMSGVVWFEEV